MNVLEFGCAVYGDAYALDATPVTYAEFRGEQCLVAMEPTATGAGR